MADNDFLLQVRDLKKYFFRERMFSSDKKPIRAVDGISFSIRKGETLGLVGESGCGKTTAGKSVLRLIEPTSGQILFKDQDILPLDREAMRRLRPRMQFIFQDPYESLNPRMRVGEIVGEGLEVHRLARGAEKARRVSEILEKVGLHPRMQNATPTNSAAASARESGLPGRSRFIPELIVADEPVSALDVSIQAQILNLLMDLRDQFGLTYLFISHDLRIVKHISDRIAVMYMGKIVEMADGEDLFLRPLHPYTQLLLAAIPKLDPRKRAEESGARAEEGRFLPPEQGCLFQPRCPHAGESCRTEDPILLDEGKDHLVACHFVR